MIRFLGVSKRYANGVEALSNVDFSIEKGEMVFLTGHSGAGKSTLLKLIALIDRASNGIILVNGRNINHVQGANIAVYRRRLGMVFQDHRLLTDRTVFDNVALPLIVSAMPHKLIKRRVQAALDRVDLLNKQNLFPTSLSAGEQQRVGIARAIVHKPVILLADEPTGNLDPALSREIMSLFCSFNQIGVTVVVATHDLMLINALPIRVIELEQGRLTSESAEVASSADVVAMENVRI